jgi:cyanate lyase
VSYEDTVNKIFDDLQLEKDNIINLHRLKQKQNDTTRTPPIVIRFNNVQQRN